MKAIYPGSFDPFHDGHLNIVSKAAELFEEVIIVVTTNIQKTQKTALETRLKAVEQKVKGLNNVSIITNPDELTVDVAKKLGAKYIIRGLRNDHDFDNEVEIYNANKYLNPEIETIYFIADLDKQKISSSYLKEIEYYHNLKK